MQTPKIKIVSSPCLPGSTVIDENGRVLAHFDIMTPDCHSSKFPKSTGKHDSTMNQKFAIKLVDFLNKAWSTDPIYQKNLSPIPAKIHLNGGAANGEIVDSPWGNDFQEFFHVPKKVGFTAKMLEKEDYQGLHIERDTYQDDGTNDDQGNRNYTLKTA